MAKETLDPKQQDLERNTVDADGGPLTTNQGVPIQNDHNSLKAGERGPTLLEDFMLREKITHFDHERIPERIVHARGAAAHGYFQVYKSLSKYTRAQFLTDPSVKTPVFLRFSTVAGSRGSSDLARDVRGFAVKFYTQDGNFDLVGNNMPVFFIQDAVKFPDLIHAVKPEPNNEIPQAASAHDTFWDFISLTPEAMHMILWVMSDRALPRSYRMMEGFGVHTFRLVNAKGEAHFVKFHWKPLLGMDSVLWEEAQLISGKDPDFHRRDLWESIENGKFAEWELGLQIIPEADEHKFDFDLLDPTKLVPEELVPVQRVGKLTLDRNPDNYFAETEQVAFQVGHVVPGIDFTNDPLLQGRLFSYTDTQLIRLGGPNFHEIPINRPIAPVHNNQRDGFGRQTINRGVTSYNPNSLGGGCPMQAKFRDGGFTSYTERIDAHKIRARSKSFFDHFTQARLFFRSQTKVEQDHIVEALQFELSKVVTVPIRERIVSLLDQVDRELSKRVAAGLGMKVPAKPLQTNFNVPADGDPKDFQSVPAKSGGIEDAPSLSILRNVKPGIATRKIAVIAFDGADSAIIDSLRRKAKAEGASAQIIAWRAGSIKGSGDKTFAVDHTLAGAASVLFDGVFVVGGKKTEMSPTPADHGLLVRFLQEAYRHFKTVAATPEASRMVRDALAAAPECIGGAPETQPGIRLGNGKRSVEDFFSAFAERRHWARANA